VDDESVLDDIDDPRTYARWRGASSGQGTVIR